MKNLFKKAVILVTALCFALPLVSCGDSEKSGKIKVYMPDGAPALALAALMHGGYENTEFTVVNASKIRDVMTKNGAADMAIMPVNQAAALYNAGEDIVMLSVNTHGNLYIVGKEPIDLPELAGKRLGVIGQGNVPDLTLRMILDSEGIPYQRSEEAVSGKVALSYYADGGALLPLLVSGKVDYALLGEPAATTAASKPGQQIVIDLQEMWELAFDGEFPQACLVVKGRLIDENKSYIEKFLNALSESDGWAERYPENALAAVNDHMEKGTVSTLKTLDADTVKRCNIKTVPAKESKEICDGYFEALCSMMTELGKPVLASVPDAGFYY